MKIFVLLSTEWQPFLTPLDLHSPVAALWAMIPLVLGICVFYKAIKVQDMNQLPVAAPVLRGKVFVAMAGAAIVLWILTRFVLG